MQRTNRFKPQRGLAYFALAWTLALAMPAAAAELTGDGFVGIIGTGFGDTHTGLFGPNSGAGSITNTTDGLLGTTADTYDGGCCSGDNFDYSGMRFGADQKIGTIIVTTHDFVDGGWYNGTPKLQTTDDAFAVGDGLFVSNGDGIWDDQAALSNYPAGVSDSDAVGGNAGGGTNDRTHFWSPDTAIEGLRGVRVLGDGGGSADGDGFIGASEIQVFEGVVQGDLATDYLAGSAGQTSTDVGISGLRSGTWTYQSDTDADPTNGGLALLTFGSSGLEGGSGYTGAGTIFGNCCNGMPALSGVGLFDGITTLAGNDILALHPGGTGGTHVGPEYLVIEYTATVGLVDVSISYDIEQPAAGDGVDWQLVADDGAVLASGVVSSARIVGAVDIAGGLGAGESVYLVIGNGAGDNPAADQTFARFTVIGNVPTPAALPAGLALLGAVAMRRRR